MTLFKPVIVSVHTYVFMLVPENQLVKSNYSSQGLHN